MEQEGASVTLVKKVGSPVGELSLAASAEGLTGLWIEGQKYHGRTLGDHMEGTCEVLERAEAWLKAYFAGARPEIDLPLAPAGTNFQQEVWAVLRSIPYGELTTYGEIARLITAQRGGVRTAPLAVGGAVGHNPISIIVPCHRVVGADGSLTGYAGGLGVKRALLELEGVDLSRLYTPTRGTAL
ncbi:MULTISPECIES: methylated-DNA--[protein]-cysteine S-methyltransferase [unclassified Adlercreutzia]|uniref:methylated-DNA--[protein]-cysteine S-methyltransferase n=1 Tax=unclassified Adlercreutzia TaxID=2636013 RepID=UPI0013EBDE7D|nr:MULTISPECIES: methylated-DNA--[protein]-cysteine S-methyltransferase [unclassified Adlercreutzia]